ncbi:hypothetical protein SAMD00023353_0600790 [Rosellinia necatrix]|uniref:Uncharacterized protein n=1 Tax=Rosellinia necatrix TaxID=77044 RepID=A0A1S8A5P5_ROSNE|nr:hypothetical protein SAMD00023353_0600790 [Rosellinia necatrix]
MGHVKPLEHSSVTLGSSSSLLFPALDERGRDWVRLEGYTNTALRSRFFLLLDNNNNNNNYSHVQRTIDEHDPDAQLCREVADQSCIWTAPYLKGA